MKKLLITSLFALGVSLACCLGFNNAAQASTASENAAIADAGLLPMPLLAQVPAPEPTAQPPAPVTDAQVATVSAQVKAASGDTSLPPGVQDFLTNLLVRYPWLAALVTAAGGLRVFAKPIFSLIGLIIARTKTQWDDGLLSKIVAFFDSKYGRWLRYGINWLLSVNIKAPASAKV